MMRFCLLFSVATLLGLQKAWRVAAMLNVDTKICKQNRTKRIRHNKSVMDIGNNDQLLLVSTFYTKPTYPKQPSNKSFEACTSYCNVWSTGRCCLNEQTTM